MSATPAIAAVEMGNTPALATSTTPAMMAAANAARGLLPTGWSTSAIGMKPGSSASRSRALASPRTSRMSPTENSICAIRSVTAAPWLWTPSTVTS